MNLIDKAEAALKAAGLDVARPGQRTGLCKAPYAIVYDGGMEPVNRVAARRVVGVMLLVPLDRRDQLDPLVRTAQTALTALKLKPRGTPQGEALDEAFRARTQTIEYTALCAL